ncbi:MAG: hypothetical protein ACEPOZ_13110 [Marinifilaceae bacterium]
MRKGRKFSMTFAELAQRGDRVSILVHRDMEYFNPLGYTEEFPQKIQSQTDSFKQILPDMFYEGQQMLKTEEKKGYREGLIAQISDLRFRAKLALGENDTRYRLFRFSSLSRMTDKDLVSYAKHVVQTATNLLPELSIRRVDQPMLDQILQHTSLLDTAIDIQAEFMALREQKQVERTAAANELYDRIAEACEVGKKIWENKNQAFYDDYVLYGSHKAAEVTVDETEEPIVNELEN